MAVQYQVRAYWVCFVASFFCVFQFLLQGSTGLMVDGLINELSIDLKDLGFLSSAFFYPYILLQIPAGFLVDKYRPRKVLIAGSLLLGIGTFLFSCCHSCLQADLARMLMGAGSALGVLACMGLQGNRTTILTRSATIKQNVYFLI